MIPSEWEFSFGFVSAEEEVFMLRCLYFDWWWLFTGMGFEESLEESERIVDSWQWN